MRPWYTEHKARWLADRSQPFSWSSIYKFSTSGQLGISAMGTILDADGGFGGCTATDYALADVSLLLQGWLVGSDASYTWVYIVERSGKDAGILVASTIDSLVIDDGGGERRRRAAESESPATAASAALLEPLGWPALGHRTDPALAAEVEIEISSVVYTGKFGLDWCPAPPAAVGRGPQQLLVDLCRHSAPPTFYPCPTRLPLTGAGPESASPHPRRLVVAGQTIDCGPTDVWCF